MFYYGTIFRISATGALTTLFSFTDSDGGTGSPSRLLPGNDGYFYGTASDAGPYYLGTVFRISTTGVLSNLYYFGGGNDGNSPQGGLVRGGDGYFYGTTSKGGTNDSGTVFKISPAGALISLYSFTGGNDGAQPQAGLVLGSDGYFYGTTIAGGTNEYGTVFKITPGGALTSLYSFTYGINGANPGAQLVQGSDGGFYGMTERGGQGGYGTVFRFSVGPTVPTTPAFQAVTLTNGRLSLTWSAETGSRYQLQSNTDLNSSNWTNVGSDLTATGATLSTTDSVTDRPHRFYRVVLLP